MNTIFKKLFKELNDGYFVEIDPQYKWDKTNYLNQNKRWSGICLSENCKQTKNHNAFVYNSYDIQDCLIKSNHSGIIHYLAINNMHNLNYIKLFSQKEYKLNHHAWRRHVIYSSINIDNINIKDELIDILNNDINLQYIDCIDNDLIFVNKLFTCLV